MLGKHRLSSSWLGVFGLTKSNEGQALFSVFSHFHPTGWRAIAAGYGREFRIWDVEAGTVQNTYKHPASPILDMRWSHNIGIIAENGWSIVPCFSDVRQEQTVTSSLFIKEAPEQRLPFRVQRAVWAWHADAFIASCEDGTVFLQRGNTRVYIASPLNGSQVRAFSWNMTDTEIAIGYSDGYIQVWDVDQFKKQYEWRTEQPDLQTLCWGKKGRIIISGDSVGKVKVWRVPEAQLLKIFETQSWSKNQDNRVTALATSSDDSFLCSAYEKGRLNVWTM
jgi:WD40 repeat protein